MTGGPKATKLRRVLSVSDGPVEVGWVPVHSAPEVRDNPLLMLQTLKSDGQPGYRICFTASEAFELLSALQFALYGDEGVGGGGATPARLYVDPKSCEHPAEAELKRLEYGVLVERRCGACGAILAGMVGSSEEP